jgi:hypothetical protein
LKKKKKVDPFHRDSFGRSTVKQIMCRREFERNLQGYCDFLSVFVFVFSPFIALQANVVLI